MEELTGKHLADLLGTQVKTVIHPDDLPLRDAAFATMLRDRSPHTIELRAEHADGTWHWFESTVAGWFSEDGALREVLVTTRDVSQRRVDAELRRDAERAREAALRLFSTAVDQAPIGMCLVALDGRFMRVNAALCRLLERTEADLLSCDFQQLTHPHDLQADLSLLRECLEGTRDAYETPKRYFTPDGRIIHAWLSVGLIRDSDGAPEHFVSQIVDLSPAYAAEQRLRTLEDRDRIARDLHDHTLQRLFALGLTLQSMACAMPDSTFAQRLHDSVEQIDETITSLRSAIYGMRAPGWSSSRSVRDRILAISHEAAPELGHDPTIQVSGPLEVVVTDDTLHDMTVVIREALSNASRALGTRTEICVQADPGLTYVAVEVVYNGTGLSSSERAAAPDDMTHRAQSRGGSCVIESPVPDVDWTGSRGTRVRWRVPIS